MAENNIDLQDLAMPEKNVKLQVLEKGDQNKDERSTNEACPKKISMEDHPPEVSPKETVTKQGYYADVNFDTESNMINSKPPQVIERPQEPKPSETIVGAQEPEPCEASEAAQETKPSVIEASQEHEPSQIIEAAQNLKKEENGLARGFDLNQEATCVGSASTPTIAKVLFDLNVVDIENTENQTLAPFDLEEYPTEGNQSINGRPNIDLNHCQDEYNGLTCDSYHCISSPSASSPPSSSSSSSSSVSQPSIDEHFDKNSTEVQYIHNYSLLHDATPVASVFHIMGTKVMISPERNGVRVPETLAPPSNIKTPLLFGFRLGGTAVGDTCSQPTVDESNLLSLLGSSSTGSSKRREPEGGLEPYIATKKVANFDSSTVSGKRLEPEGGQEPYKEFSS